MLSFVWVDIKIDIVWDKLTYNETKNEKIWNLVLE